MFAGLLFFAQVVSSNTHLCWIYCQLQSIFINTWANTHANERACYVLICCMNGVPIKFDNQFNLVFFRSFANRRLSCVFVFEKKQKKVSKNPAYALGMSKSHTVKRYTWFNNRKCSPSATFCWTESADDDDNGAINSFFDRIAYLPILLCLSRSFGFLFVYSVGCFFNSIVLSLCALAKRANSTSYVLYQVLLKVQMKKKL